jgi:hypothetical protein
MEGQPSYPQCDGQVVVVVLDATRRSVPRALWLSSRSHRSGSGSGGAQQLSIEGLLGILWRCLISAPFLCHRDEWADLACSVLMQGSGRSKAATRCHVHEGFGLDAGDEFAV